MNQGKRAIFVDGENLVFRYQEMCTAGRTPKAGIIHIPDVFVWHSGITQSGDIDLLRVGYYTSAVGDDAKLDELRLKIARIPAPFTHPIVEGSTDLNQATQHWDTTLVRWTYSFPPAWGKVGMGDRRMRHAARLCTPTLALPRLRGRGACVPISRGLI